MDIDLPTTTTDANQFPIISEDVCKIFQVNSLLNGQMVQVRKMDACGSLVLSDSITTNSWLCQHTIHIMCGIETTLNV